MAGPRFALEPLLERRRLIEERLRADLVACARACVEARAAWERAAGDLHSAARDRCVLERLEARGREAWLARERRLDER